jgi:hypothetical protein
MDPAKLQKQLAELMKVVQEERKLRAQAEAVQKTAKTLLAQNTQTQNSQAADLATAAAATHTSKGAKIGVPDKFDGTRGVKAEVYPNQVGFYVISNGHLFPNDCNKFVFSLWYLTGQASAWAQQFMTRAFAGKDVTYKEFSTAFQAMYFDTEKKTRAEKALQALKQTKTAAHYTHAFSVYAHNAGWEHSTLISQYTQGLKHNIRLALVLARTDKDQIRHTGCCDQPGVED